MYRKILMIAATMVLLFVLSVASVGAASPPQEVHIEADIDFGGGPGFGPFVATGPAVDAGLICASGDVVIFPSNHNKLSGNQGNMGFNVQATYAFTCDDGSGEFYIKLQVRIDQKGDNFNWVILRGDSDYEKLHGTGKGIGIPLGPGRVLDIYDGKVHID